MQSKLPFSIKNNFTPLFPNHYSKNVFAEILISIFLMKGTFFLSWVSRLES